MNKASAQDDFRMRRSSLWAFVPMATFALSAAISAPQHVTVTHTNAGERPVLVGVAQHSK